LYKSQRPISYRLEKSELFSIKTFDIVCTVVVEVDVEEEYEESQSLPILTDFVTDCVDVEDFCITLSVSISSDVIEGTEDMEGIKDPVDDSDDAIELYE